MARDDRKPTVAALLDRYRRQSFTEQAEIRLSEAPNTQYQALQLAVLLDARVRPDEAVEAFRRLRERRLSTAGHVVDAAPATVAEMLTERAYDERDADRAATAMTDAALHLQEDYGGRLQDLRGAAGHEPERERALLRGFAQMADTTIDALFREVQAHWSELLPFADKKVLDAAGRLDLPTDARRLRDLVDGDDEFVRLADCLVRVREEHGGYDAVRAAGVPARR